MPIKTEADLLKTIEWLNDQLQSATRHEAALGAALWDHPAPACSPSCKSALAIMTATRNVSPAAEALLAIVAEIEELDGVEDEKLHKLRFAVARFRDAVNAMKR